jgi:hypothetical protein
MDNHISRPNQSIMLNKRTANETKAEKQGQRGTKTDPPLSPDYLSYRRGFWSHTYTFLQSHSSRFYSPSPSRSRRPRSPPLCCPDLRSWGVGAKPCCTRIPLTDRGGRKRAEAAAKASREGGAERKRFPTWLVGRGFRRRWRDWCFCGPPFAKEKVYITLKYGVCLIYHL